MSPTKAATAKLLIVFMPLMRNSHLYQWGIQLFMKKGNRNIAVAAVARKLTTRIWYALNGQLTDSDENKETLTIKLRKVASSITQQEINEQGFKNKTQFISHYLEILQTKT